MSRTKKPASLLPLPAPLLRHHGGMAERTMHSWKETGDIPPVLLISGPAGIGKRSMVHHLAQWILCHKNGIRKKTGDDEPALFGFAAPDESAAPGSAETGPCGKCPACQRALGGNWLDFTEISTDTGDETSKTIKIDQFRKLKETVGFGAYEGAYRIILIRDAEKMTNQAGNSLLKLLEEPPTGWLFFLTASDESLLLATIVSRCQRMRFTPVPETTLLEFLQDADVPRERMAACARLAHGSWRKAMALADDMSWTRRQSIMNFVARPAAGLSAIVDWAASGHQWMEFMLDQIELVAGDLVALCTDGETGPLANCDHADILGKCCQDSIRKLGSKDAARAFWINRATRAFAARQEITTPLNAKLLAQDVLIPWLEA
ncbi:MAG: hypothetical protein A2583_13185 [Bdellovibrionales bacterium RIFOXYD1_FULL_53_11]|nr:MAG: hypothetical protein A2583_13185 [Bdellovibrionales bacterium RIFOXYD1_FULL_53_11]